MGNKKKEQKITQQKVKEYVIYLQEQEKSTATIKKYAYDFAELCSFLSLGT